MARIDLDRLYALFNSEASEQDGNFYFVKQYDEKLYSRLCKIERNAVDRKSTRLNSSHPTTSRMPSSA